jgi:hypothetical protein
VEGAAKEGVVEVDVLDIAHKAGLKELNEEWPWRPIWCWWWHWRYPWYRWCCPWWWYRCHWYPIPL